MRTIRLSKRADYHFGTAADELILGGDGNDYIHAGAGDDILRGGNGNDILMAMGGRDRLTGGPGADRFWSIREDGRPDGSDVITDFKPGIDKLGVSMPRAFDSNRDRKLTDADRHVAVVDGDMILSLDGVDPDPGQPAETLTLLNMTSLSMSDLIM